MLQGYLTGQLSSALEVESLRQEFKRFTDDIENSVKKLEGEVKASFRKKGTLLEDTRYRSSVYTRWGKKTCPPNAELVFSGFAGGSYYSSDSVNVGTLCLPKNPEWGIYTNIINQYRSHLYGAVFNMRTFKGHLTLLHNSLVPCAVCLVHNRSVVKTFSARKTCYKGWRLEYQGYLMAGATYVCVDKHADRLPGRNVHKSGNTFHPVEAICSPFSLKCPPYVEGRELVCAVCSKL